MKKKLLYLFIAISSISFSQTLEKNYTSNGSNNYPKNFAFLTSSGLNYYTINSTDNEISIYDSNHTLYKTVSISLTNSIEIGAVFLASDKLFNSNNKIEFIIRTQANRTEGSENKMLLFDEDGTNLFDFGDRWEAFYFKDENNNFKLLTETNDKSDNITYDIYGLSGTLSSTQEAFHSRGEFIGFPNPSSNIINITNPLKNNEKEKIEIYDINGKKVIEKEIIGNGKNIELNISNLSKGIYSYRILGYNNKFVKK